MYFTDTLLQSFNVLHASKQCFTFLQTTFLALYFVGLFVFLLLVFIRSCKQTGVLI